MTTDAFTAAARAEAERITATWTERDDGTEDTRGIEERNLYVNGRIHGAEWARTHLAAQEPTEAEIRAFMKVAREFYSTPVGVGPQFARAALAAARAVRQED